MAPSDPVSVPEYRTLLLTRQGRRLTITLNRPELLNACNYDMHEELADVFQFAHTDRHSDVIVVTGSGRAFSAGGDIPQTGRASCRDGVCHYDSISVVAGYLKKKKTTTQQI